MMGIEWKKKIEWDIERMGKRLSTWILQTSSYNFNYISHILLIPFLFSLIPFLFSLLFFSPFFYLSLSQIIQIFSLKDNPFQPVIIFSWRRKKNLVSSSRRGRRLMWECEKVNGWMMENWIGERWIRFGMRWKFRKEFFFLSLSLSVRVCLFFWERWGGIEKKCEKKNPPFSIFFLFFNWKKEER